MSLYFMPKFLDISGQKINKLTAISVVERGKRPKWLWRCECGTERVIQASNVRSGNTKSCGCWREETRGCTQKIGGEVVFTHQKSGTPEYRAWSGMKERCSNPRHKSFHNYGGRGIRVCQRWLESFNNFFADMGPRPSRNHSMDRWPDKDGNYEPGNVRWATPSQQMNNVRYNCRLTIDGTSLTIAQWCRHFGVKRSTYASRIERGLSPHQALTA